MRVLWAAVLMVSGCVVWPAGGMVPLAEPPVMRWDHRPGAEAWTAASFAAVRPGGVASVLPTIEPRDIEAWCPGYRSGARAEREAFWVGLLSSLARHESTWRPEAVGGGGRWFGLVQISPATARGYGCSARSGSALLEGEANLRCALRIWASTVSRDGVVAAGRGGVAADWGPFVQPRKRADMQAWVRQQDYCSP